MTLFLAAALLLQDRTAEETFQKIEDAVEKATSFRVQFRSESTEHLRGGKANELALSYQGTMLMKEPRKFRQTVTISSKGRPDRQIETLSDGSKSVSIFDGNGSEREMQPGLNRQFAIGLARVGVIGSMTLSEGVITDSQAEQKADIKQFFVASKFRVGEVDQGVPTLHFHVDVSFRRNTSAEVRLWYEPKTLKILKRTVDFGKKDSEGTIRESYGEFSLNPELADDAFRIPAGKK